MLGQHDGEHKCRPPDVRTTGCRRHKKWRGLGPLRNCRLRTVSEAVVFCMDQDSTNGNEALRHCWIKGPAEENVQLSLTFDVRSGADDLDDFDKMLASVAWR